MEVKPGYKQTEVGVIPEEWDVDSLGCIGRVIRGSSPRPKGDKRFYGGNVPRLMVEDVTRDRKYVTPTIDFLTVEGAKLSRPCKKGTLTVVCSGTPTVVGLPSILAVDACIHDGMLGLVHLSPTVEPEYLFYRLTDLQEQLHAAATHGGTFVNLTTKGFGAFRVAVPPPPEQRAIATALRDVDGLLGGLDRLIAKKRDLKQAAMQQLLTGQTRLPGFASATKFKESDIGLIPEEWEVKHLSDVSRKITDGDHLTPSRTSQGYYLLSARNVVNGRIDVSDVDFVGAAEYQRMKHRCGPESGDILISCSGTIGRVAVIPPGFECVLVRSVALAKIDRGAADSFFLQYWLQSSRAQLQISNSINQGAQPNLFLNHIERLACPIPPLPEQTAIAEVLTDMDGELAVLEQRREKTRALKQAMMQELLTGRTRLI